jgi:recombination protein RecA
VNNLREKIIGVVDKEFGAGKSMVLSQIVDCGVNEWISTGSILVNGAIHRPGIPVGRLTAIAGRPMSGKSTLAQHLIRSTQEAGGLAVILDTEHRYDPQRAARIGIKNDEVLFYQDLCLEDAFSILYRIADVNIHEGSKQPVIVILDSHSGTATKAEVEAESDAQRGEMASSARVTSLHLKRIISSGMLSRARIALVFICQLKAVIAQWGGGETYVAQRPIDYHSTLILRLKSKKLEKKEGISVTVKVVKNGVGPAFSSCELDIFADGIDESRSLLELACEHKVVTVGGGGHYVLGDLTFRRREWPRVLEANPSLQRELFGFSARLLQGESDVDECETE